MLPHGDLVATLGTGRRQPSSSSRSPTLGCSAVAAGMAAVRLGHRTPRHCARHARRSVHAGAGAAAWTRRPPPPRPTTVRSATAAHGGAGRERPVPPGRDRPEPTPVLGADGQYRLPIEVARVPAPHRRRSRHGGPAASSW